MTAQDTHSVLNDLLNQMSRSLLQYMGESWPWNSARDRERQELVNGLVRRQQFGAERIAELLQKRRVVIEFENYPQDRSHLHYVTLDFFKPLLIEDQLALLEGLKAAAESSASDSEALRLLEQIVSEESQTLEQIRSL